MTGTPTLEEPKSTSSYDITNYLTTQHHWQVSVDGGPWSENRGINDPSLINLPTVAVPEPTIPTSNGEATISGFVRTPDGQGVEGIEVCASKEQQCSWTVTDEKGRFSFNSLSSGKYILFW